jgi:peptidyl-prolyl cis-trans isomerase A (cyclophilin A)
VDRFYNLVRARFFDDGRFFRVVGGFVAQFGLSGDPKVNAAWKGKPIPDDPVRATNHRGTLAFARSGPASRSVQLYFNLVDNTPRLDTLNGIGFPPIAETVEGLAVLDSLYAGYGGTRTNRVPGPSQDSIEVQGNAYLERAYPKLDYIRTARIVWESPRR